MRKRILHICNIFRIFIDMKTKITILTWMAVNNDPKAFKSLLEILGKEYDVNKVIYLYQKEHVEKLKEIKKIYPVTSIEVDVKNPTAHKEIYGIVKIKILPLVTEEQNLVVNTSPGTPAMHAVWLILYAGGHLPNGTQLISHQINRKTDETSCDKVDFPISTYLSELRKYEKENPNEPYYAPEAKSKARQEALEKVRVYASVQDVPMLLLGERGIGKSRLVESYIATIKKKKVVTVACGTLDSTLAESAMFGHKKGAFTGASESRKGYLEEADGKILFLDEIQDLPRNVQRKLLRTLQDKDHRYRILGDTKETKANVELVCASNLTEKELRQKLDPDFYDRISFYKVVLPPLRVCRGDIFDDWNEVWKTVRLDSSPAKAPMDDVLKKFFTASNLPGNFRSLQTIAYQFIAWQDKKTTKDILDDISFNDGSTANHFNIEDFAEFQNLSWSDATKRFQHFLAEYAYRKFETQEKAAKKIGCSTKTLQNALKEMKN